MLKKIVIIGPESTGKSTLSMALAAHFHTTWVPEYARKYIDRLQRDYRQSDLLEIARGQVAAEEEKMKEINDGLLFCDTDLYVIKVWSEHKYNSCATEILWQIAKRKYDLYLLTYIDVPWSDDPQREYPEPEIRSYFYQVYKDIVVHSGVPWLEVRGDYNQRLNIAVKRIEKYIEI